MWSLNVKLSPATLCQLFPNGKTTVIGGTTEKEAKQIFDMYLSAFFDLGYVIEYTNFHIQNIVACYKHHEFIRLDHLARRYGLECEPERFPAARYGNEGVTVNIFHTVSRVTLGVKTWLLLTILSKL